MTRGARGEGVAELIDRLLATNFSELDTAPEGPATRERVLLAGPEGGRGNPVALMPQRQSLLLAGVSGGGKSTLTLGLIERLDEHGFQCCVLDPEGD